MDIVVSANKYDSCCRTCLYNGPEEMYDICVVNKDELNVCEMLSTYTSISVIMEDHLPKKLCATCYNCLLSFHNFINTALNADKKLKDYFSSIQFSQVKQEIVNCGLGDSDESLVQIEVPVKQEIDIFVDSFASTEDYIENDTVNISNEISQPTEISENVNTTKHTTKKKPNLEKHIPPSLAFKCLLCTEIFSERKQYIQHLLYHSKEEADKSIKQEKQPSNQSFHCDVCSCTFKSVPSLSAHKKVHTAKDRVLQCTFCNKLFKKISHLKRHELSHNSRQYKCTLCTKSFAREDSLVAHMDKHNEKKNHRCPVCMRMFGHIRTLTNHIRIHTREKPYLCPTCGKMFDSTTNLNQHIKRHMGLKLFACNLCPKTFVSKGELKAHIITHTGKKSFICEQCNAAFTKRGSLEKHKMTHLGVKPHQCDVCVMKFVDKNHLKRHYRIHTGEKPYRCDICDRAFTQTNDLVKHKRTHLGNNLYKCDECSQSFRLKTELWQHISEHFVSTQAALKAKAESKSELPEIHRADNLEILHKN